MENVYSQVKMFHFPEKLRELEADAIGAPVQVRLKPINACNHRCFYCCYRSDSLFLSELLKEKDMIPREKMREIVADLAACGVRAVTFSGGGEPLIYPWIVETAAGLLGNGIKVATLTNGSALAGDVARVLAEGASWVRVSIDAADPAGLVASRGVDEGEFDKIVGNIERFAKMKHVGCELGINFIITKLNAHKVFPFIRTMRDHGVNHVKVSECIVSTRSVENNAYHAEHFDLVKAEIARCAAELNSPTFHVVDKFHDFDDKFDKKYARCPFLHFLNVVAADLNVYTCQDKAYTKSGILGSIRDTSLREVWASPEYAERVRALNPSVDCNHHCVSHGKNLALNDYLSTDRRHLEFV